MSILIIILMVIAGLILLDLALAAVILFIAFLIGD